MTASAAEPSGISSDESDFEFSPSLREKLDDACDERLTNAFLNIMTTLANLKKETDVYNHMYKSSPVGFGNYAKVNELSSLVHAAQDAIQTKLGDVQKQKSDVEAYFKTHEWAPRDFRTYHEFSVPGNTFRDCMWSTLGAMRKSYRAEHAVETSPRSLDSKTRNEFNAMRSKQPEVAERYQSTFESSKVYADATDNERAVYQRFKSVLMYDEETRPVSAFKARACL